MGLVRDMVEEAEEEEKDAAAFRKTLLQHVRSTFKAKLGAEEFSEAEEEYAAETLPKRFVPLEVNDGDKEIIDKLGPPDPPVHIAKIKTAGHYTVTYMKAYVKSYSWTWIRDPPEALQLSLKKAWETYEKKDHIKCPPAIMEEIMKLTERDNPWRP